MNRKITDYLFVIKEHYNIVYYLQVDWFIKSRHDLVKI